jgi:hypothetical protein
MRSRRGAPRDFWTFVRTSQPAQARQFQDLRGLVVLFSLLFLIYYVFPLIGGILFEPEIDPTTYAALLREINPFFSRFPDWMLWRFNINIIRYAIPPTAAVLIVLFAAARYVKDIYDLRTFDSALRYVVASMFAVRYPSLRVKEGRLDIPTGETKLLDAIGGPGNLIIDPGNAVLLQKYNQPNDHIGSRSQFLQPFENVAQVVDLAEQEGTLEGITAMTRDGIMVKLTDVRFRYRIIPGVDSSGREERISFESPYPFNPQSVYDIAYNLSMNVDGPDPWRAAIARLVKSTITDYINGNTIDELTAPRNHGEKPRDRLQAALMNEQTNFLTGNGARLSWVDVGHFDIPDETVDRRRVEYWAAEWAGEANIIRAAGEGRREGLLDYGRARTQARMIQAIASELADANLSYNTRENIRRLLLTKTTQILDVMRGKEEDDVSDSG